MGAHQIGERHSEVEGQPRLLPIMEFGSCDEYCDMSAPTLKMKPTASINENQYGFRYRKITCF